MRHHSVGMILSDGNRGSQLNDCWRHTFQPSSIHFSLFDFSWKNSLPTYLFLTSTESKSSLPYTRLALNQRYLNYYYSIYDNINQCKNFAYQIAKRSFHWIDSHRQRNYRCMGKLLLLTHAPCLCYRIVINYCLVLVSYLLSKWSVTLCELWGLLLNIILLLWLHRPSFYRSISSMSVFFFILPFLSFSK